MNGIEILPAGPKSDKDKQGNARAEKDLLPELDSQAASCLAHSLLVNQCKTYS